MKARITKATLVGLIKLNEGWDIQSLPNSVEIDVEPAEELHTKKYYESIDEIYESIGEIQELHHGASIQDIVSKINEIIRHLNK